jgi:hypothetical protein
MGIYIVYINLEKEDIFHKLYNLYKSGFKIVWNKGKIIKKNLHFTKYFWKGYWSFAYTGENKYKFMDCKRLFMD